MSDEDSKVNWGPGPWQDEPDRLEWEHHGVPCLALRNERFGNWCGYAAIPPGHPWHGRGTGFDDEDPGPAVHGGVTYAAECAEEICHVPKPGEPDNVWWLGFDCHHYNDLAPGMRALLRRLGSNRSHHGEVYRDLAYVKAECESMAEQILARAASVRCAR